MIFSYFLSYWILLSRVVKNLLFSYETNISFAFFQMQNRNINAMLLSFPHQHSYVNSFTANELPYGKD